MWKLLALGVVCLVSTTWAQVAPVCEFNSPCFLPDCYCSSTNIPEDIPRAEVPQIVYLTFDDAINAEENYPFYEEALFNRLNPNGARISATFFVTHEYNDYNRTHDLYRRGHEIALHSITHQINPEYWSGLSEQGWRAEFVDQRAQLARFANIPENQIKGIRAPFLQGGGDPMYKVLSESRFEWECSRPTWNYRPNLYPYTADYRSIQDCQIAPCPQNSYPGFWVVPMVDLLGGNLFPCAMVDNCQPTVNTTQETLDLLRINFLDHYSGNRAPFGVFTHAAWIIDPQRKAGYIAFLDYLRSLPDVYIVSISKALEWMRTPVPSSDVDQIAAWQPTEVIANGCPFPRNCRFNGTQTPHADGAERYMMSCQPCDLMAMYPWLNNPFGSIPPA